MQWKIVASTEVPQDGRLSIESIMGVWIHIQRSDGPKGVIEVLEYARGCVPSNAVYVTIMRMS